MVLSRSIAFSWHLAAQQAYPKDGQIRTLSRGLGFTSSASKKLIFHVILLVRFALLAVLG